MSKKRKRELLLRLPSGTEAYLEMNTVEQILKDKGLDPTGDVQRFHTANVLRRILRYMPRLSGLLVKATIVQTNIQKPVIVTDAPEAEYLFEGKVMVSSFKTPEGWRSPKGKPKKVAINRNLKYTKHPHTAAGPHWDKALSTAEGKAMAADLQRFIERKR